MIQPDLSTSIQAGEPIGETEAVGLSQLVEVLENLGRWLVVVGNPGVEGQPGATDDGLGGNPGQ